MPKTICSEPAFIKIWLKAFEADQDIEWVAQQSGLVVGSCFRKKERIDESLTEKGLETLPKLKPRSGARRANLDKVHLAIRAAKRRKAARD